MRAICFNKKLRFVVNFINITLEHTKVYLNVDIIIILNLLYMNVKRVFHLYEY